MQSLICRYHCSRSLDAVVDRANCCARKSDPASPDPTSPKLTRAERGHRPPPPRPGRVPEGPAGRRARGGAERARGPRPLARPRDEEEADEDEEGGGPGPRSKPGKWGQEKWGQNIRCNR